MVCALRGSTSITTSIGLSSERVSSGLIVEIADRRIGKAGACQFGARRIQFVRLQPRDPAGDDEIGLEGIDRGPQRLQHVGLHHRGRAEQARGDPRQQFAFGQPVLNQAGVNVDRARQRDAVDGQFLIVDAIGREHRRAEPRSSATKPIMKPSRTTRLLGNEKLAKKHGNASADPHETAAQLETGSTPDCAG